MSNNQRRMPAEWEPQGAVLIAWPHEDTDWAYMLDEARQCYCRLAHAIALHAVVVVVAPDTTPAKEMLANIPNDRKLFVDLPTNDTWTRDYGPITVRNIDGKAVICDFGFNAWGGKFDFEKDNAITRQLMEKGVLTGAYRNLNDFILEGGSIESDGNGTILTTTSCLLTPTRNASLSRTDIEKKLSETLGARKVLWLDKGEIIGDDTDGHIDTIARLAPGNTILYCGPGWATDPDEQSQALTEVGDTLREMTTADGEGFNLIELPLPDAILDADDGHRLPATYANFLVLNDAVLMPVYGQPHNDLRAEMALKVAFPDHVIEKVDCRALIRQHGSLHCATMQLPKDLLPI